MTVQEKFIPLNYDALFLLSGFSPSIFAGFAGILNAGGSGAAGIYFPPESALVGFTRHASFVTADAKQTLATYNPVKVLVR